MSDLDDAAAVNELRKTAMSAVLYGVFDDLVSHYLAVYADEDAQAWADRIYERLHALTVNDLALGVVMAMDSLAREKANDLWQHLWSDRAEDLR